MYQNIRYGLSHLETSLYVFLVGPSKYPFFPCSKTDYKDISFTVKLGITGAQNGRQSEALPATMHPAAPTFQYNPLHQSALDLHPAS